MPGMIRSSAPGMRSAMKAAASGGWTYAGIDPTPYSAHSLRAGFAH